jgi:hypothetical protein
MNDTERKRFRLAIQFPKRCGCGRAYLPKPLAEIEPYKSIGFIAWGDLPFAYVAADDFADMEARHCYCGSTIAILTKIHDLSKE